MQETVKTDESLSILKASSWVLTPTGPRWWRVFLHFSFLQQASRKKYSTKATHMQGQLVPLEAVGTQGGKVAAVVSVKTHGRMSSEQNSHTLSRVTPETPLHLH